MFTSVRNVKRVLEEDKAKNPLLEIENCFRENNMENNNHSFWLLFEDRHPSNLKTVCTQTKSSFAKLIFIKKTNIPFMKLVVKIAGMKLNAWFLTTIQRREFLCYRKY
jgi:hypothetical protein